MTYLNNLPQESLSIYMLTRHGWTQGNLM